MFPQTPIKNYSPSQEQIKTLDNGFQEAEILPNGEKNHMPLIEEKEGEIKGEFGEDLLNPIKKDVAKEEFVPNPLISSKLLYVDLLNSPSAVLYINQIVPYEVRVMAFSSYNTIAVDFSEETSVEVLNKEQKWSIQGDGTLVNTYYLKIKQLNYKFPDISITLNTKEGEAKEILKGASGKAINLEKANFSSVIAKELVIKDTKITSFDEKNNLAVFQLKSQVGNLLDFKLKQYKQQGIESKSGDIANREVFYYVIVPKELEEIAFEYFNTDKSSYVELKMPNLAEDDKVSTQSDITPKNNYQIYQILVLIVIALLFFGLYFYKRKWIFIVLAILPLFGILYILSIRTSATLVPNTIVRIQPTFNSTIILQTEEALKVEVITQKRGYYKVVLEDGKIGWVKENDVQN
ncbi:SH3 domain-containing protein [Helicobacter burdigaliensis]|uniref:SH3 domain-containing protein n=1 Tax=Helicobacter burdigaliensis TaxID=2315334 RepID=UPI0013006ADD|nr:SH3 domain-containing protein [Helicobacter burdigaliensis]